MPIVTVSGVDGSGKTTQIERLVARLRADGRRVTPFWFRPGYSDEMNALRALARRVRPGALPRGGEARRETFARPGVRRSWVAMAFLDTLLQYALKVRALSATGRVVVCDRYLDDGALDLELRFPELRSWTALGVDALRRASPTPDAAVLLMLPVPEMERRLAAKDEPFPDPPAQRRLRHALYEALATSERFAVVDASPNVDAVHAAVWEAVCAGLS